MNSFHKMSQLLQLAKKSVQTAHRKVHLISCCHVRLSSHDNSKVFPKHSDHDKATRLRCSYCVKRFHKDRQMMICGVLHTFNSNIKRGYTTDTNKFSLKNDVFKKYVESILDNHSDIHSKRIAAVSSGKKDSLRFSELSSLKEAYEELIKKYEDLQELNKLEADVDMKELAKEEKETCLQEITELEEQVVDLVSPLEQIDESDIILEVESGAGGQEAMLFAQSIFQMYENHAAYKGWEFKKLDSDETSLGGIRSASAAVSGQGVYREMKFEGGIHRVQRIPVTEKGGRIHTSTISVAILPQPSEIDLTIHPKDLRMETMAACGPGGQHAQKNETAVRLTHIPTGTVVFCAQERSQAQNKKLALAVLRSRIYNKKLEEERGLVTSQRKIQVGQKERSEKIRTYNYPQGRITDHRIGRTVYNIDLFLQGGSNLDTMIQELLLEARREELEERIEEFARNASERQMTGKK